jgi:hypothetical protein
MMDVVILGILVLEIAETKGIENLSQIELSICSA